MGQFILNFRKVRKSENLQTVNHQVADPKIHPKVCDEMTDEVSYRDQAEPLFAVNVPQE